MSRAKKFDFSQFKKHVRDFRINYKILIYNTLPQLSPPSLPQQREPVPRSREGLGGGEYV